MINVTSSSPGWVKISSSPFGQNVEFFSATGQILDSWLENYTSTHAIWWVKLTSSIPAGSKQTIYMGFAPTSTNLFNTNNVGEAPQLSSTYAEYDDGANIFNNYWNFAGTSLPSGWVVPSGMTFTVNNGATFSSGSSVGTVYYSSFSSSSPFVMEVNYYPTIAAAGIDAGYGLSSSVADFQNGYLFWQNPTLIIYSVSSGVSYTQLSSDGTGTQTQQIISAVIENGYQAYYENYNLLTTSSSNEYTISKITQIGITTNSGSNTIKNIYWFRTRAYPPNGVMPSVSFGSVS